MARPSRTGGKTSAAKIRKASPAEGRKANKTKHRSLPTAARTKRSTVSDLSKELKEARQQQAATADILKVIASSPTDVEPVLTAIVESACVICEAQEAHVALRDGDQLVFQVQHGSVPVVWKRKPINRLWVTGRAAVDRRPVHVHDLLSHEGDEFPDGRELARRDGTRTMLTVPLLREGECIGVIAIRRMEVRPFSRKQIELLQTFADQAVIAVGNVRLFEEVQARTRDLSESLQQQTATADVLKVISRSAFDLQTVLETLVESAATLCNANGGNIRIRDGDVLRARAFFGASEDLKDFMRTHPIEFDRRRIPGRAFLTGELVHVPDVLSDPEFEAAVEWARMWGYRAILAVPMVREGRVEGVFSLSRTEPRPFSDREIELVRTFVDQALIAIENVRLFNETKEALQRQTATADILKVISSSPSDVQPVFEAIVSSAARLIGDFSAGVYRFVDGVVQLAAITSTSPAGDAALRARYPRPIEDTAFGPAQAGEVFQVADTENDERLRDIARERGFRSVVQVPLRSSGISIGVIAVARQAPGPFAPHQVELLQTFADQAVIAIENVRLFNETKEALEQQTATSEVLEIISSSPGDLDPVFHKMLENACRVCEANFGTMNLWNGEEFNNVARHNMPPAFAAVRQQTPIRPHPDSPMARIVRTHQLVHEHDFKTSPSYLAGAPTAVALVDIAGARTLLVVPMLKEDELIGTITIYRQEVRPFTDKQIALVENFTKQAVIAIENTRLLKELRQRTDDLSESLQQQTATSEVLKVIASSLAEVGPVLQAIVESACQLCESDDATVALKDDHDLVFKAQHGSIPIVWDRIPINRQMVTGRAVIDGQPVHVRDLYGPEGEGFPDAREFARQTDVRTVLSVPLLREGESIGVITLRRTEVEPFSDKQINLLQTFADQAVIAIKNVELFEEVQARTRDLSESLEQQTATSEVLQVISSSSGELGPVFNKMLENATRICGARFGTMTLYEDGGFRTVALYNAPKAYADTQLYKVIRPHPESGLSAVQRTRKSVYIADIREEPPYVEGNANVRALADLGGARTIIIVPMLRDSELVGTITIYRQEVKPFTDKQTELVSNFANQAVIAIENARLLKELRQRTDDLSESLQFQTATADVLKVISRSPDALKPVLDVIVQTSRDLCNANSSVIFLMRDNKFHVVAASNEQPEYFEPVRANPIALDQVGSAIARAGREMHTVHVRNSRQDTESGFGGPLDNGPARSMLAVPLIREGHVIGGISLGRAFLDPFSSRQIEAIESFADQAVIAIANVSLFDQVQQRTKELLKSLEDLRSAQDRLIQTEKLASLGQLTAGIAHEIKNPLNFVNNFSALSAELVDEVNDVLSGITLELKPRQELEELTALLKSNLEKVVQHGKRADSIVKNMLLHSRSGSGEHRPVEINAVVEESLNLAYHGARAEGQDFNITLERDFDQAGVADIYPQEITRVLLNLISNGLYAATKRAATSSNGFEPKLRAATRNLGDQVEIRIRDNGMGIPTDIREKIFNPFFTTKPAGEGTGLGLSMSHDIVVKQHGGRIDVVTEPGSFTEFVITLPRVMPAQDAGGG